MDLQDQLIYGVPKVPGSLRAKEHVANSYPTLDALATAGRSVSSFLILDAWANVERSVDSYPELGELVTAGRLVADEMECWAAGMLTGLGTLAPDVV